MAICGSLAIEADTERSMKMRSLTLQIIANLMRIIGYTAQWRKMLRLFGMRCLSYIWRTFTKAWPT